MLPPKVQNNETSRFTSLQEKLYKIVAYYVERKFEFWL